MSSTEPKSTKPKLTKQKSTTKYFKLNGLKNVSRTIQPSCESFEQYRVDPHVLGEGSYGKVMPACDGQVCTDVAKIISFDTTRFTEKYRFNVFLVECAITQFAGEKGFGIPVKKYYLCDEGQKGVIIMERFKRDLMEVRNELTWEDMKQLLDKVRQMHSYGILHRDLFLKNTMYRRDAQGRRDIRIIDFGMSIAFEKQIPDVFCAIDYMNLLSDLPNEELRKQCLEYIGTYLNLKYLTQADEWIKTHYTTCQSEYSLLKHIPLHWIELIGPATIDTMVWSVRCDPKLDQDIIHKTEDRVEKVLSRSTRV